MICPYCDATVLTPATPAVGGEPVAWRWRWKDKLENNPWRLVFDASGISHITAETQPLYLSSLAVTPVVGAEELRKLVAAINVDEDKHLEGNLQYVLIRGFSAMGWSQPTLASNEALDAIVAVLSAKGEK